MTVVGTYPPTSVAFPPTGEIPAARATTVPAGRRAAPWALPDQIGSGGIAGTTTHVPELGVWTAVLDMTEAGLNHVRDLDGLAEAGVSVEVLDEDDLAELAQNLPGAQRVRAALGRILLRRLLTDRVDPRVPPEGWVLSRTGSGRLIVHGDSGRPGVVVLQGPDVVVAAVGRDLIGVDIEAEPSPDIEADLLGYSSELLTPEERLWLAGLPPTLVREDLARLWTLKRAAASAVGLNVLVELGLVRARLSPPSVRIDLGLSRSPLGASQWPVTIGGTRRWISVVAVTPE
ncbi:MAG: 4'-phosphopantetheinyl transferase superfamily protein [Micrococcales bacterium]|nr:4'-phosphopantetheinyl transferase superfamily protein [Micrococcales bacterium]